MAVVRRRLLGVLVLGVTVLLGWAALNRDAERRVEDARRLADEARLLACPSEAEIVELRLDGPQGTLVVRRPPAPAPAQGANEQTAGEGARDGAVAAAGTPDWSLFVGEGSTPVPADTSTVQATVQAACALAQLGNALVLPADAQLASFGLAPPRYVLQLLDANKKVSTLQAGAKSSFDGSLYVRRDANDLVRRVDGAFAFQLERDAFSLRDKRLVRLEPHELVAVRVASKLERAAHPAAQSTPAGRAPTTTTPKLVAYALTRDANGAVLAAEGRTEAADPTAAQALFASLAQLRAARFVADAPDAAALARFGLERPQLVVELATVGNARLEVRFGRLELGGEVHHFAQAGERASPVAELPSAWVVDKLVGGARELRDMRVLALEADDVASFTVTEGQGTAARRLRFSRRGEADVPLGRRPFVAEQLVGDANGATSEATTSVDHLDEGRVATVLHQLCALRADTFDDAPVDAARRHAAGVEPPVLSIAFVGVDGQPLSTLRLGPVHDNHRTAVSERRPAMGQVFAAALEGVDAAPEHWQVTAEPEDGTPPR